MSRNDESCHGVLECLHSGSGYWILNGAFRPWQKLTSYVAWYIENWGWSKGLRGACVAICRRGTGGRAHGDQGAAATPQDVLALQPGELVEVKPIEEILATLDTNRRNRGLRWMTGMRKYCGQRYRVYRRVQRIALETNGELRTMKNTVLLEGVMCDGAAFGGCDRSCFHFWREAWLKRVPAGNPEHGEAPRGAPETAVRLDSS